MLWKIKIIRGTKLFGTVIRTIHKGTISRESREVLLKIWEVFASLINTVIPSRNWKIELCTVLCWRKNVQFILSRCHLKWYMEVFSLKEMILLLIVCKKAKNNDSKLIAKGALGKEYTQFPYIINSDSCIL